MNFKLTPSETIKRKIDAYGFTNFIDAANTQLKLMASGTVDHAILEYLLKHAVGAENAKNWKQISGHLDNLGLKIPKNRFQNNLLQQSRRNTYFIGSSHKGFFIFEKPSDVEKALAFYNRRIDQEMANRDALRLLASKVDFARAG